MFTVVHLHCPLSLLQPLNAFISIINCPQYSVHSMYLCSSIATIITSIPVVRPPFHSLGAVFPAWFVPIPFMCVLPHYVVFHWLLLFIFCQWCEFLWNVFSKIYSLGFRYSMIQTRYKVYSRYFIIYYILVVMYAFH